ncbi:MAG TPA: hypothetical protein VFR76_06400, partial [Verrucomicrobiae bacterium]|nr:hypothetical protein [Verrucomicrobiae bacterium]
GPPVHEKVKIYGELMTRTERSDDRKVILSGLANLHEAAALKLVEPLLTDFQVQAEAAGMARISANRRVMYLQPSMAVEDGDSATF